jgi:beta-lactamase regulating signal transducer with metallopeptidase domain
VPRWVLALPQRQRQFVLKHEDEHRRAHDAQLLLLAALPLIAAPWNVVAWWQARRFALAVETDCDRRVVDALGDVDNYSATLVDIAAATSRGPQIQPAFLGGMLERRLKAMLQPAELHRTWRLVLAVAAIAILAVVLMAPHPVTAAHAAMHR